MVIWLKIFLNATVKKEEPTTNCIFYYWINLTFSYNWKFNPLKKGKYMTCQKQIFMEQKFTSLSI